MLFIRGFFLSLLLLVCACTKHTSYNHSLASKGYDSYSNCDFSPFIYRAGVRFHRRQKAVLFVQEELIDIAKEAADLLEQKIGITLFEIKPFNDIGNGTEVYISSDKVHYEHEKKRKEPNSYLAYCNVWENYNKETGEIYESDIVFNPILYDRPRELYKKNKRIIRANDRELERREEYLKERKEWWKKERRYWLQLSDQNKKLCSQTEICSQYDNDFYLNKIKELEKQELKEQKKILKDFEEQNKEAKRGNEKFKEDIYFNTLLTMIHEMGHTLGYKHTTDDPENIMFPSLRRDSSILTGRQINAIFCAFGLPSKKGL